MLAQRRGDGLKIEVTTDSGTLKDLDIVVIYWGVTLTQILQNGVKLITEPFAKLRFSFKIKACKKFYHRHMVDIPRIKF